MKWRHLIPSICTTVFVQHHLWLLPVLAVMCDQGIRAFVTRNWSSGFRSCMLVMLDAWWQSGSLSSLFVHAAAVASPFKVCYLFMYHGYLVGGVLQECCCACFIELSGVPIIGLYLSCVQEVVVCLVRPLGVASAESVMQRRPVCYNSSRTVLIAWSHVCLTNKKLKSALKKLVTVFIVRAETWGRSYF